MFLFLEFRFSSKSLPSSTHTKAIVTHSVSVRPTFLVEYSEAYKTQDKFIILRILNLRLIYKVKRSLYKPEVYRGFQEVKVPRLHENGPGWW